MGQRWLKDLDGGRYRDELYAAHLGAQRDTAVLVMKLTLKLSEFSGRDNAIMLTTGHVLSIWCVMCLRQFIIFELISAQVYQAQG